MFEDLGGESTQSWVIEQFVAPLVIEPEVFCRDVSKNTADSCSTTVVASLTSLHLSPSSCSSSDSDFMMGRVLSGAATVGRDGCD